jgi:hypothetical protein
MSTFKQVSLVYHVSDDVSETLFIAAAKEWCTQFKGVTLFGHHCKELQERGNTK